MLACRTNLTITPYSGHGSGTLMKYDLGGQAIITKSVHADDDYRTERLSGNDRV